MRLFIGIDLPEDVSDRLERLLDHLRPLAHFRWSPVYNLHITVKFIGAWPAEKAGELTGVLSPVAKRPPIPISIEALGWFPNPHSPRVFWAGVHGGPALTNLAKALDTALEPLGVARETREYSPHLTLARISQPVPLQPMRQAIAQLESTAFGQFTASKMLLYESQPGAAGSVYVKLAELPFSE